MRKDLVISCTRHETKVAILEDEQLVEIYFERPNEYSLVGSVHKGRVTRVLPGMQAAFVNIGLERDAFLYVSDFFEPSDEVEPIEIAPGTQVAAQKQPAPEPAQAPATAQEAREREKEKAHRGRRRRRRGLPREKYVTPAEETHEFVVLPGESLAKYGTVPAEVATAVPSEEEAETELRAAGPEASEAVEVQEQEEESWQPGGELVGEEAPGRATAIELAEEASQAQLEPGLASEARTGLEEGRPGKPAGEEVIPPEASTSLEESPEGGSGAFEPAAVVGPGEEPTGQAEASERHFAGRGEATGSSLQPQSGAPGWPGPRDETGEELATPEPEQEAGTAEAIDGDPMDTNLVDSQPVVDAAQEQGTADPEEPVMETGEAEPGAAPEEQTADQPPGRQARTKRRSSVRLRRDPNQYMRHPGRSGRARRLQRPSGKKDEGNPESRDVHPGTKPPASISDLLREGQELIVQVAKEPIGQKGARITCHVALPGRYVVYMPTIDHLGVSRKIPSEEERRRLRRILQSAKNGIPGGFIARTAAEGCSEQQIVNDMKYLYNLWLEIRRKAEKVSAPALLYHDLDVIERVLRDQLTPEFDSIWVDDEQAYERVVRFLEKFQPDMLPRVRLYTRSTPIFDAFNITQELEKALKPKVWLKSGGYIVINQTEALVAIDVNTGKFVGQSDSLEDTIVKTNLEAVKEIVRQIRLRDLGGIIVVDFIDMEERKNRQRVMQALEEAMKVDRAPYNILQVNEFGLVAITRKRVKQSLERALCSPCPYCEGAGYIKSVETIASEILAQARRMAGAVEGEQVLLRVHPDVARVLKSKGYREELEEILGRPVMITSDPALHHEKFDLA